MAKIIKYAGAYLMWIIDLGLTLWLVFISRTVVLGIFAMSFQPGSLVAARRVDLVDKFFWIILGLGWLAFMIASEAYFRTGVTKDDLLKRFARVSGPVLLVIFGVDLILFWLQGAGGGSWLRWLVLVVELGIGIALLLSVRRPPRPNPR